MQEDLQTVQNVSKPDQAAGAPDWGHGNGQSEAAAVKTLDLKQIFEGADFRVEQALEKLNGANLQYQQKGQILNLVFMLGGTRYDVLSNLDLENDLTEGSNNVAVFDITVGDSELKLRIEYSLSEESGNYVFELHSAEFMTEEQMRELQATETITL